MKKIILTISLLFLVSPKNSIIEFGKEATFDKNNKEFEFTHDKPDIFFIQAIFRDKLDLKLFTDGIQYYQYGNDKGGVGLITNQHNATSYKITLDPSSSNKGTIWVNPSTNELKLDMNKKVEWKFDIINNNSGPESKLTYVIDKAEKNATFVFKYANEIKDTFDEKINVPNPFQVCHGDDCKDNIATYDFKIGESYKIYIKYNKIGNHRVFPSFSFYDKKNNAFGLISNLWVIYLLLIFIL